MVIFVKSGYNENGGKLEDLINNLEIESIGLSNGLDMKGKEGRRWTRFYEYLVKSVENNDGWGMESRARVKGFSGI